MFINRLAKKILREKIQPGKVLLLYGPRRVGKTTILNEFAHDIESKKRVKFLNGENRIIQEGMSSQSAEKLNSFVGEVDFLIIDEAQQIPNIGLNLKLLIDNRPDLSIIASGSASFSLAQEVGEPLTGRKKTIILYPIAAREIINTKDKLFYLENLENYLIYGAYPELFQINDRQKQREYLSELTDAYLFRDILTLENVRNPKKIRDLLTLLAFQIGHEVSLTELSKSLSMSKNTVERYLDLLEKSFVIINIRGFSRNLRKEVTKMSRYYFYDNGVRNAIINNFNELSLRDDVGALWENYLVMERMKKQAADGLLSNNYFWRTYDQKEIDWVEDRGGKLYGYEFSWNEKTFSPPNDWVENYPAAECALITKNNFLNFIG